MSGSTIFTVLLFVTFTLCCTSTKVFKFKSRTVSLVSFTESMETKTSHFITCFARCSASTDCRALYFDKNQCKQGILDLNNIEEPQDIKLHVYIKAEDECLMELKHKYLLYRSRIITDKLIFLANKTRAEDAQAYCESLNATLITIKTKEEFQALDHVMENKPVHIGLIYHENEGTCLNSNCDGKLHWIDGSAFKFNKNIYSRLFVNENSPYIMSLPGSRSFNFHDTRASHFLNALCQVNCSRHQIYP